MKMDNRMLVSALLLLMASSSLTILGNHAFISAQEPAQEPAQQPAQQPAQETTPSSTAATYTVEATTPESFENGAKVARDSARELIEESIQRPTEISNTTESVNVEFTDEFGGANQNLVGATATSDYVKEILDNIIDGLVGNSTSLSFTMKVDTDCQPDCQFKIALQK